MRLKQNETLQEYKGRLIALVYAGAITAERALALYERAYCVDRRRREAQDQVKTLIYS
jgi:hypothetical protein